MASVHALKMTEGEVVLKIYSTQSAGETVQIELDGSDIKKSNETFIGSQSKITIREIFWGTKNNKHIDISRVDDAAANTVHGHYYFINAGHHNFDGFVDDVYANGAIRIVGDGEFHCILKLGKYGYDIT